eukprot:comp22503_c0_seq1/m.34048 comp22503_c0_seq1/g.34048  ORF comp22503_c0_seq1/g.34048 comp22503_c0_seq1/m.34048 type:complete len:175 (-) comp22503_c0_seq1:504-1028(-)
MFSLRQIHRALCVPSQAVPLTLTRAFAKAAPKPAAKPAAPAKEATAPPPPKANVRPLPPWEVDLMNASKLPPTDMLNHALRKDLRKRITVAKYESERRALKAVTCSQAVPPAIRMQAQLRLHAMPKDSCPSRIRNRSLYNGKGRSIIRDLGVDRFTLRDLAHKCLMPGVHHYSY